MKTDQIFAHLVTPTHIAVVTSMSKGRIEQEFAGYKVVLTGHSAVHGCPTHVLEKV